MSSKTKEKAIKIKLADKPIREIMATLYPTQVKTWWPGRKMEKQATSSKRNWIIEDGTIKNALFERKAFSFQRKKTI